MQQLTVLMECRFMGPFLFSALWAMVLWGFIQLFFRWGACSDHLLHASGVWLTLLWADVVAGV